MSICRTFFAFRGVEFKVATLLIDALAIRLLADALATRFHLGSNGKEVLRRLANVSSFHQEIL